LAIPRHPTHLTAWQQQSQRETASATPHSHPTKFVHKHASNLSANAPLKTLYTTAADTITSILISHGITVP